MLPFLLVVNEDMRDLERPLELLEHVCAIVCAIGAIGAIYCILLGIKIAKAKEPQDQMKAKQALKNSLIGCALIFVFLVTLKIVSTIIPI